jgi:hypothetical protein
MTLAAALRGSMLPEIIGQKHLMTDEDMWLYAETEKLFKSVHELPPDEALGRAFWPVDLGGGSAANAMHVQGF